MSRACPVETAGRPMLLDCSGVLVWPEKELLAVADLHLEKGSSFARRGALLPPYDTRATLERLAGVLAHYRPRRVLSLGDGFHDPEGWLRLAGEDRDLLARMVQAHEWIWILGNHDPIAPRCLGGRSAGAVEVEGIVFRHEPQPCLESGEVAGHLHPKASVTVRGRRMARPCFVGDRARLIMPAFGSFTGGLDVRSPAIAGLFRAGCSVWALGRERVYPVARIAPRAPG